MTTYSFPSIIPNSSALNLISNTKVLTSPLNGATQSASRSGTRWHMQMNFKNLSGANRRTLQGFLAQLDGQLHRTTVYDHSHSFGGTGNGSPIVKGASQTGNSLLSDGWANSEVVMLQGDEFQVGGELKMCTSDVTSDGSGNAAIPFVPEIHTAPADNSAIDITNPTGIFMLVASENGWVSRPGVFSDMTIDLVEDVLA